MNIELQIKQLQFYLEKAVEICKEFKFQRKLFPFEDLVCLDDRAIQKILRDVDLVELAKALKGTKEEVQEKIFRNMSSRGATMLKEDMEFMGPVIKVDVIVAQQTIVGVIEKLEASGEIVIPNVFPGEFVE